LDTILFHIVLPAADYSKWAVTKFCRYTTKITYLSLVHLYFIIIIFSILLMDDHFNQKVYFHTLFLHLGCHQFQCKILDNKIILSRIFRILQNQGLGISNTSSIVHRMPIELASTLMLLSCIYHFVFCYKFRQEECWGMQRNSIWLCGYLPYQGQHQEEILIC
jgi:hypothetical protein